ncbi:MAG: anthranilate phosphoribosyltransferase [Planctomycetota bacterium]
MTISEAIGKALEGADLTSAEAADVMGAIMSGAATDAQIAGFLIALRAKGETAEEIAGCARAMRAKATRIAAGIENLIDTCGTGGDKRGTFNISTAAALVATAAGARVAKHGNRGVSSASGSADVIKALGVKIDLAPARMAECLQNVGIAFLFAPLLHEAMKYAIGPRRELGVRTIFNVLGPLTNPAGARRQILGVYSDSLVELVARALLDLGSERALVVRGEDGLDEMTTCGRTTVCELCDGRTRRYTLDATDLGLPRARHEHQAAKDVSDSADAVKEVLRGTKGPRRDIVALNAAGALWAAGIASDLADGLARAQAAVDSGKVLRVLEALVAETNR